MTILIKCHNCIQISPAPPILCTLVHLCFVKEKIAPGWTHQQLADHFQSRYPGDTKACNNTALLF